MIRYMIPLLFFFTTPASGEGWPREISHIGGVLRIAQEPEVIVSTSPSLTGTLLAIGAPVTATAATTPNTFTDSKGFFTQWAKKADENKVAVLYNHLTFDLEAVMAYNPDLVVVSATGAGSVMEHVSQLDTLGLPNIVVNYSSGSWQELARKLGAATGSEAGAERAIEEFAQKITDIAAELTIPAGKVTLVGYNIAGTYSVGRAESPHAALLRDLGFDVAPLPEGLSGQITRSSDFDFVSRENLSGGISGETIFLLRATEKDVAVFLSDPLLANHPAVKAGRVYALGPLSHRIDYFSGLVIADLISGYFAVE